jgi:hypothetical protein
MIDHGLAKPYDPFTCDQDRASEAIGRNHNFAILVAQSRHDASLPMKLSETFPL